MPTYEWRCTKCGERVEVQRSISEYDVDPAGYRKGKLVLLGVPTVDYAVEGGCANLPGYEHEWVRVVTTPPCVPFERMREQGVFERLPQTSLRKPT